MAFDTPHSCTLPTAGRPLRLAEFDTFLGSATAAERAGATHLTLTFGDSAGREAQVRDLTARESSCCSFFEFDVAAQADHITLGIRVPDQHADILDALESRIGLRA